MARKIYSYPGITSGIVIVPVGKAKIRLEFNKGNLDSKIMKPALYSTSDPTMQAMIENSDLYGKRIFLYREYSDLTGAAKTAAPQKAKKQAPAPVEDPEPDPEITADIADEIDEPETEVEVKVYEDVTDVKDVAKILKGAIPGIKAKQLLDPAALKRIADANGYSFPNVDFEQL